MYEKKKLNYQLKIFPEQLPSRVLPIAEAKIKKKFYIGLANPLKKQTNNFSQRKGQVQMTFTGDF